jgi:glycosyltransferase involved in cell wall biosynthesis
MNVAVSLEHRFYRTPDGAVWTDGLNAYSFWTRYLTVFDGVKVIARIRPAASAGPDYRRADGPGVDFRAVPDYLGPWQYLARALPVRRAVREAVDRTDAVIMRVSSQIGGCLEPWLTRHEHPYGLEVVNDPYDVFAPGSVEYRLRPLFRYWFTRQLRRQCRRATGVAYVTEKALQRRYPCAAFSTGMSDVEIAADTILAAPAAFTTHYSSVELPKDDAVPVQRTVSGSRKLRLITIASLAQMYKAPDVLIRAVSRCVAGGLDLSLAIAGDGKHREELACLVRELGMQERIRFLGQIPSGAAVRDELDRSDLFVLASRCEGLPRAMVEAMARALPCIGSTVGGIPELLAGQDLVPPGDVDALAAKIREILSSPDRMAQASSRNLAKAQEFREDVLAGRRRAFLEHLRRATAAWLASSPSGLKLPGAMDSLEFE